MSTLTQNNEYQDLPELVRQYLFYITTIKNRSPRTASAYAVDLRNFFKFYKLYKTPKKNNDIDFEHIKIDDIDIDLIKQVKLLDVYEYLNFVMQEKNNSAKARARKVSSIRGFFKYLTINLCVIKENPVEHLEMPSLKKSIPKYLSIDESKELLKSKSLSKSENKFRDYCILTLFLNCGMRLSELVNINLGDIKIEAGSLKLLGKGNKERIVFLNEACISSIKDYIEKERSNIKVIKNTEALFLSIRTGNRLGARQIQKIVQASLRDAGLSGKGYSPHKLRHTAATLLYQHGKVDILVLKELLGHVNVGTTEIYTHISNDMIKEAVIKNPLSNEKIEKSTAKE